MLGWEPIRCWRQSSAGAIAIGETFTVVLTCAVYEADNAQVVPDESRLGVASIQMAPFEILGGSHPPDVRRGSRRFFQYDYQLRIISPDAIGRDVNIPPLPISYRIHSRVGAAATLEGRDLSYVLPMMPIKVLSLVPADASDIRDASEASLGAVDSLRFRSSLFRVLTLTFGALAAVMVVLALVPLARGRSAAAPAERGRIPDRAILARVRRRSGRRAVAGHAARAGRDDTVVARARIDQARRGGRHRSADQPEGRLRPVARRPRAACSCGTDCCEDDQRRGVEPGDRGRCGARAGAGWRGILNDTAAAARRPAVRAVGDDPRRCIARSRRAMRRRSMKRCATRSASPRRSPASAAGWKTPMGADAERRLRDAAVASEWNAIDVANLQVLASRRRATGAGRPGRGCGAWCCWSRAAMTRTAGTPSRRAARDPPRLAAVATGVDPASARRAVCGRACRSRCWPSPIRIRRWSRRTSPIPGRRISLMIDASDSMQTSFKAATLNTRNEVQPAFFTTVAAAQRFVELRRKGKYRDLMALVEFGSRAYVITPFTSDYDNLLLSMALIGDPVEFSTFPESGHDHRERARREHRDLQGIRLSSKPRAT